MLVQHFSSMNEILEKPVTSLRSRPVAKEMPSFEARAPIAASHIIRRWNSDSALLWSRVPYKLANLSHIRPKGFRLRLEPGVSLHHCPLGV